MVRSLAVVVTMSVLVGAVAEAQVINPGSGAVVKPRVLVIFDTSTSMKEAPDYNSSFGLWAADDTSTDPDMSPVPDASCRSKFCIAKKTVYEVLRNYVDDNIRLGVASYYQFLVKYDPIDNRISKCWYDAMWKPGQPLRLPNTGAYMPDVYRLSSMTNVNIASGGVTANLYSNHRYCRNGSANYDMTGIEESDAGFVNCTIHDRLNNPAPASVTLIANTPATSGCNAGRSYSIVNYNGADTNSGAFYNYRIPAASSCPANAGTMGGDYTAVGGASVLTVTPSTGSSVAECGMDPYATNCWETPPFPAGSPTASCSTGHPCRMYSNATGSEGVVPTQVSWIAGFSGSCTGGLQPALPNIGDGNGTPGTCALPSLTTARVPGGFHQALRTLDGPEATVTSQFAEGVGGTCHGLPLGTQTRVTVGNLNQFISADVYANWQARVAALSGVPAGTLDPGITGACNTMACDVTLTNRVPNGDDVVVTDVNTCVPVMGVSPAPSVTCNDAAAGDIQRQLLKTGASCPAVTGPYASSAALDVLGTWASPTGGYNCTAGDPCNFVPYAPAEVGGTIPGCNTPLTTWNGAAPANCTGLGQNRVYTSTGGSQFQVYIDVAPGSACTATTATASYTGVDATAATELSSCLSTGACNLYSGVGSDAPTFDTYSSTTSTNPPVVVPAWGNQTDNNLGTFYDRAPATCGGYNDGQFYNLDGLNLRFRQGAGPNGTTQTGMSGETPLYSCRFERVQRQWTRPRTRCRYEIRRTSYTTDNTITWCNYAQQRIRRTTTTPLFRCEYQVPIRRFQFTRPNHKVCSFFRTTTTLTRPTPQVRYTYNTLGGEMIGSYFTEFPAANAVSDPYASFAGQCPAVVDECMGAGTTCYLRTTTNLQAANFNQPTQTRWTNVYSAANRYSNSASNYDVRHLAPASAMAVSATHRQLDALSPTAGHLGVRWGYQATTIIAGGHACRAADFATPPVTAPATRTAFAAFNGAILPPPQFKLASDYFDCVDETNPASCVSNNFTSINTDGRAAPLSLRPSAYGTYQPIDDSRWTSAPTKAYGASSAGPSYLTPGLQMMRFPADNDPDGDLPQFKQLMSRCDRPSPTGPDGLVTWPAPIASSTPITDRAGNKVEWNSRGLCFADTGAPNAAGINDFTPLYGSLQNARQYLAQELATDVNHQCRRYFVVLATDGAENTPRNAAYRNVTALTNAVTALRSTTSANGRTTAVNTFVLGFGDAVVNPVEAYNLDQMAIAGNTTGAYFATNRADLMTRLSQIFNTITQGTYSRSRPVLTADGQGLYAAFYDVGTNTPEWEGRFAAIGFNGSAQVTRWELGRKMNDGMLDSDRNIYTVTGANCAGADFDGICRAGTRRAWTLANQALLTPLLNTDPDYYGGPGYNGPTTATQLNPLKVLEFVRNLAKVTGSPTTGEQFFQSGPTPPRRLSRYGATVKSVPVLVGRSYNGPEWGGRTATASRASYATFQAAMTTREPRVVLGSSDGLIRGIRDYTGAANCGSSVADGGLDDSALNCANGKEAWGFVPEMLQPVLYRNTTGYNFGVDGETWLEDICTASNAENCDATEWKTVAYVGMRGGARGVQALDITDPNDPKSLWAFRRLRYEDQLGYPITAAVGRVEVPGGDRFIAVVPGGTRQNGIFGDLGDTNSDEVYVLNAATGEHLEFFNSDGSDDCTEDDPEEVIGCNDINGQDNQIIAKPSYFRRVGSPYMDHMVMSGTSGLVYIMRFRKTVRVQGDGTVRVDPREDSDRWAPHRFFDPTNNATSRNPVGDPVRVRRVIATASADGGTTYSLSDCSALADGTTCGALPLPSSRRLPLHNRPRVAAIYDPSGYTADYFFGTGDTLDPVDPAPEFTRNYFYAVHDRNDRDNGRDDARPMWVNQFLNAREQVVADAVLVNGNVIVTTYLPPPPTVSDCTEPGSAYMYCFNPKTGDLSTCFSEGGTSTAVRPLGDIGIPSPPACLGDHCYILGSNSPRRADGTPELARTTIAPARPSGDTRSFRRVR